jgi:hypothetical protein
MKQGMPGCKHIHNGTMGAGLARSKKKEGEKVKMIFASKRGGGGTPKSRQSRLPLLGGQHRGEAPPSRSWLPRKHSDPRLVRRHMTSQTEVRSRETRYLISKLNSTAQKNNYELCRPFWRSVKISGCCSAVQDLRQPPKHLQSIEPGCQCPSRAPAAFALMSPTQVEPTKCGAGPTHISVLRSPDADTNACFRPVPSRPSQPQQPQ